MTNAQDLDGWTGQLKANIKMKIYELKRTGTTGMGADNLWMVVKIPQHGGPADVSQARRIFNDLIAGNKFILPPR